MTYEDGALFVSNCDADTVSIFRADGSFVRSFGSGELGLPMGVAVDGDRVYVCDFGNKPVSVYF